jgi:hypothetical protein
MRPESVARPSGIESPRSYVARPRDGCDGNEHAEELLETHVAR